MSALVKFLVTFFFVVIILWLAIFNRSAVEFSVYPFVLDALSVPLAIIILGSVLIGFIWGALIVWLNGGKTRSEARRLRREVKNLEQETAKKEII